MRRDPGLIRELMLKLEAHPMSPGDVVVFQPPYDELAVAGRTDDEIDYHLNQILLSGYIEDCRARPMIGYASRSSRRHDFLDAVRQPETWAKTRGLAEKAGGFTLDLLKDIAKGVIKGELLKHGLTT